MARKQDPETFDDADTAPVPSRIYKAAPLRIDEQIRRRINPARKPSIRSDLDEPSAIYSGRRALRHAIDAAVNAKIMSPPDWREDWMAIQDAGKEAADAIDNLIKVINKDTGSHVVGIIMQARATESLSNIQKVLKQAAHDADILKEAGQISTGLAADCERRLAEISKEHPRVIEVEKKAFVLTLAKGWTYLMETRPGSTTTADQNPFLRFVEAAWLDWKETGRLGEENFVGALNQALIELTPFSVTSIANDHAAWRGRP